MTGRDRIQWNRSPHFDPDRQRQDEGQVINRMNLKPGQVQEKYMLGVVNGRHLSWMILSREYGSRIDHISRQY
jgi:hypothetical protein